MKLRLVVFASIALSGFVQVSFAQGERRLLDLARVPAEGNSVRDFVPEKWKVEREVGGDLNGDAKPDVVLSLIEDLPENKEEGIPNERFRALLVLLKTEGGKLGRVGAGTRVLGCTTCGGTLGDPFGIDDSLAIEKGVVVITQLRGSRESVETKHRFRYDAGLNACVLIGRDMEVMDRLTGSTTRESSNYLTGLKIIEKTRLDRQSDREVPISTKRERTAKLKKRLEDVDYEAN